MKKLFPLLTLSAAIALNLPAATAQDTYTIPAGTPAHIVRGVQAADRPDEDKVRDVARKPAEVLALAGLKEGDRIAEISSFGEYYTRILSAAVGPQGHIYMYDMPYMADIGGGAAVKQGREFPQSHPNTSYELVHYSEINLPNDLDAVYNIQYYHDLQPLEVDTAEMNAKIMAALKPGGIYLIEDHKAEDGSGWRDAATIHRMGKETIVEEITAAGFELVTDSDLLANPDDDRSVMVFAPGTRGATDRALLVFKKPG